MRARGNYPPAPPVSRAGPRGDAIACCIVIPSKHLRVTPANGPSARREAIDPAGNETGRHAPDVERTMKQIPRLSALALSVMLVSAACSEGNRRPVYYPGSARPSVGERTDRGNGNGARPGKSRRGRDELRCNAGNGKGNGNGRCRNGNRGRGNGSE